MSIRSKIEAIVSAVLRLEDNEDLNKVSRETHEVWDSANHLSVILSIEDEFQIQFPESEIAKLNNVADLVAAVERRLAQK